MQSFNMCDEIAESISPVTLKNLVQSASFVELIGCFDQFSRSYAITREQVDLKFINLFRSVVRPSVETEGLLERYLEKIVLYRKLAGYKAHLIPRIVSNYLSEMSNELARMSEEEIQTIGRHLWLDRKGLLCTCVSHLFFSIEHSCKIACCLGDPKFANRVAKGIIVGHNDVFQVLKHLAGQGFLLDFDSLRRIYAYIIKTRMIADYTEFFYEQFDVGVFVPLLASTANIILNSQRHLLFQCAGV